MPEEIANMLGDSKDMLEDPSHINFFDIDDEEDSD